jgi:Ring finger domain
MVGTTCTHMFHYDCCMQWVQKGNEECPYCRKSMISPQEFYQAAVNVVGTARVEKLRRINEEAKNRVAALAAAGRNTIPHPVPPTLHTPIDEVNLTTSVDVSRSETSHVGAVETSQTDRENDDILEPPAPAPRRDLCENEPAPKQTITTDKIMEDMANDHNEAAAHAGDSEINI